MKGNNHAVLVLDKEDRSCPVKILPSFLHQLLKHQTVGFDRTVVLEGEDLENFPFQIPNGKTVLVDPWVVDPYIPSFQGLEHFVKEGIKNKAAPSNNLLFVNPEHIKKLLEDGLVDTLTLVYLNKDLPRTRKVFPIKEVEKNFVEFSTTDSTNYFVVEMKRK